MTRSAQAAVDGSRLREDVEVTGGFGRVETESGWGRTVLPGTFANKQAREYFVEQLRLAGLEVRVDPVGNIAGRYEPASVDPDAAAVAAGSHLDSVPYGGIFDGPLGVYGALEAVRAIDDADVEISRPIDVVSFTEEEGVRFTDGTLGSLVASGKATPAEMRSRTDDSGETFGAALEQIGFAGTDEIDATTWDAWLELHVEQGEKLIDSGAAVGVVTSIAGIIRCTVEMEGVASHSGTAWMDDRTDALVAASELVTTVEATAKELAARDGGETVGTVGELDIEPGAVNVVPGRATLRVDIRSTDYANMETIMTAIHDELDRLEAARGVETSLDRSYDIAPIEMSERCQRELSAAAEAVEVESIPLHSGAGHDTMRIADVTDGGLLFAPSEDGVSHNPAERTAWADCTDAVRVLTDSLVRLATQ
jgi:hydantoinase/carbamoylase family amidase